MPPSKETLPRLLRLQARDRVLDGLQAELDRIPVEIAAIRAALEAAKNALKEAKDRTTRLQLAKKEKELELSRQEEGVRKHQNELNVVKSNEAYKALQSEIEKAKAAAGDLETDILTLMEDIDKSALEEKSSAARLKEAETAAQGEIARLESRRAELSSRHAGERAKRDEGAAAIGADVIKIYDHLRNRKQGVALAPVDGKMCGACHILLRPQTFVELARGARLVTCEACQRILYAPEAVAAGGPAAPAGAPPPEAGGPAARTG